MLVTDFYQRPLSHLRRTTIRQMAFSEIAPSRRFLQIVVERSIELQISGHCLSSKSGVIEYGLALKRWVLRPISISLAAQIQLRQLRFFQPSPSPRADQGRMAAPLRSSKISTQAVHSWT